MSRSPYYPVEIRPVQGLSNLIPSRCVGLIAIQLRSLVEAYCRAKLRAKLPVQASACFPTQPLQDLARRRDRSRVFLSSILRIASCVAHATVHDGRYKLHLSWLHVLRVIR